VIISLQLMVVNLVVEFVGLTWDQNLAVQIPWKETGFLACSIDLYSIYGVLDPINPL